MIAHRVDAQRDNFGIALGEFGLQARHVAELGGAHGSEIFRMRKQNCPSIADPLMKVDRPLCGFGAEIGGCVIDAWNLVYGWS